MRNIFIKLSDALEILIYTICTGTKEQTEQRNINGIVVVEGRVGYSGAFFLFGIYRCSKAKMHHNEPR
jgi:hypothetical protein